jgi:hypothetical protein
MNPWRNNNLIFLQAFLDLLEIPANIAEVVSSCISLSLAVARPITVAVA